MYHHILVPTDGSEIATKAVMAGIELARSLDARLTFVSATEPFSSLGDRQQAFHHMPEAMRKQALQYLDAAARQAIDEAMKAAAVGGVAAEKVLTEASEPHGAIIATANSRGVDLIVMGSHGRSGIKAMLLGSVARKVLTHCKLPIMIVR